MVNKWLRCLKKVSMLNSKFWKKKSPFMIYADFESIVVPEDNRKQNPKSVLH